MKKMIVSLIVACFYFTPSWSANFQCSKASLVAEKTICADSVLSKADSELGAAFREFVSLLPAEERESHRLDQLDWLGMRSLLRV